MVEGAADGDSPRKKVRGSTLYCPTSMMTAIGGLEGTKIPRSLFWVTQTKHSQIPQPLRSEMSKKSPNRVCDKRTLNEQYAEG